MRFVATFWFYKKYPELLDMTAIIVYYPEKGSTMALVDFFLAQPPWSGSVRWSESWVCVWRKLVGVTRRASHLVRMIYMVRKRWMSNTNLYLSVNMIKL